MTKPKLTLIRGKDLSAEQVAEMFERMTGKKLTPEQLEEGRAILTRKNS